MLFITTLDKAQIFLNVSITNHLKKRSGWRITYLIQIEIRKNDLRLLLSWGSKSSRGKKKEGNCPEKIQEKLGSEAYNSLVRSGTAAH